MVACLGRGPTRRPPTTPAGVISTPAPVASGHMGLALHRPPVSSDDATLTVHGALAFRHLVRWPVRWNSVGAMGWFGWLSFLQCYHHVISMDHDVQGILTAGVPLRLEGFGFGEFVVAFRNTESPYFGLSYSTQTLYLLWCLSSL